VSRCVMNESAKTPAPTGRTIAVTIAGTLFLLWAVSAFLVAVIAIENAFSESSASAHQPVGCKSRHNARTGRRLG